MYAHIVNLLPKTEQKKRRVDLLNYYTLMAGAIAVTGVLVLTGLLLLFDQVYKANLTNLQSEKAQAESQASQYLDVEKQAQDLELQIQNLEKANNQTTQWATLIAALRSMTPPKVSITSLDIKSQQVSGDEENKSAVSGAANSRRSVGQFQLALSRSPFLKDVQIENTTLAEKLVEYNITFTVDYSKLDEPSI